MCGRFPGEDVGPEGVDKGGKGGKFLIRPPTYKDKAFKGYIATSETYGGFALLRSTLRAGLTPTSPKLSPTASGSNSIL